MWEFLKNIYKETSGKETMNLTIIALLEMTEKRGRNIEIAVMKDGKSLRQLEEADIEKKETSKVFHCKNLIIHRFDLLFLKFELPLLLPKATFALEPLFGL
ncbi:hypothetical protein ZIOFF_056652 [Zingiber officinale]|uniref:Uncharacterized protein n=1 Tax=Zingiber officinale TaxID=94328 RepID=A0A8J5FGI5_ZINOF|nr:hypothetical protein ZIOFF_056652 [Zingiber officinale]